VEGELKDIRFSSASGFGLSVEVAEFDLVLLGYQDVSGSGKSNVTNCDSLVGDFTEVANVRVDIEWYVSAVARWSILTLRSGVFHTELGIQGGAYAGGINVRDGASTTTTFTINDDFLAFGGIAGPFASLKVGTGMFKTQLSVDSPLLSIGSAARPKHGIALTLGVGCEF